MLTKAGNFSLFMPVSNTVNTGIKIVTSPVKGGLAVVMNLFSADGELLALLSAAELTAFRTALAVMTLFVRCTGSGGGVKRENIVVFGSGRQAEWHARLALALSEPGEVKRITVVNRTRGRLEALEKGVLSELKGLYPDVTMGVLAKEGTPDYEDRLKSELSASDVIFSCTPSTQPNFPFSYLKDSASDKSRFISLIGSYKPNMQEIDTETLLSGADGKVYVDSKEACLEESGELINAGMKEDQLIEIGEVFEKSLPISVPAGRNVIFKCVGMGIMDLVIAKKVLDVATSQGDGMYIEGFQDA
ncbi:Proline utilization protein PrnX [Aspergillus sclerotialis]|uniref:Proline utilization protein PrnX n=1 Tax=Aspergillus sclerotialis TaxID=2070753 RepID=A0A3A2Z5X4_9EURO|nr:Proline utilization protein PrnX [Aspergillus sclerotialis]